MKISYKPTTGGSYTTLVDEGAGDVLGPSSKSHVQALVQEEGLFRSDSRFRAGRQNFVVSMPLQYIVTYSTRKDCITARRTLGASLCGTKVHLKIEEGTEVQYMPNAVSATFSFEPLGVSAIHGFEFVGDMITASDPT